MRSIIFITLVILALCVIVLPCLAVLFLASLIDRRCRESDSVDSLETGHWNE